jgi:hypothetical protein
MGRTLIKTRELHMNKKINNIKIFFIPMRYTLFSQVIIYLKACITLILNTHKNYPQS